MLFLFFPRSDFSHSGCFALFDGAKIGTFSPAGNGRTAGSVGGISRPNGFRLVARCRRAALRCIRSVSPVAVWRTVFYVGLRIGVTLLSQRFACGGMANGFPAERHENGKNRICVNAADFPVFMPDFVRRLLRPAERRSSRGRSLRRSGRDPPAVCCRASCAS